MALSAAMGSAAQAPGPLAQLAPGEWLFREPESGAVRRLCITHSAEFLQLQHVGAPCTRTVLTADAHSETIAYVCRGSGQGRTTIIVDSAVQVRLTTQGLAGGQPFDTAYDGRRIGRCAEPLTAR